jgi:hypothetical protein
VREDAAVEADVVVRVERGMTLMSWGQGIDVVGATIPTRGYDIDAVGAIIPTRGYDIDAMGAIIPGAVVFT